MINSEFYQKTFSFCNSTITRGELECLPSPMKTLDVSDAQMQFIVEETHKETADRWRLPWEQALDFENERIAETWWSVLEKLCAELMPYWEDVEDWEDE